MQLIPILTRRTGGSQVSLTLINDNSVVAGAGDVKTVNFVPGDLIIEGAQIKYINVSATVTQSGTPTSIDFKLNSNIIKSYNSVNSGTGTWSVYMNIKNPNIINTVILSIAAGATVTAFSITAVLEIL